MSSVAFVSGAGTFINHPWRVVMDRLKHAVEKLESPTCPSCGLKMQWCGSELVKFVPVTSLHLFNCATCVLLAESETVCEPPCASPANFAGSGFRFFALAAEGRGAGPPSLKDRVGRGLNYAIGQCVRCSRACWRQLVAGQG